MSAYRVLARKYRPQTFDDLVGQEALVRTLTNAIRTGRIAHAFLLTGIRGIGKTTTARIIARALNCIGEDGKGGPTPSPCGICANCTQILEDRHVDVTEMDAASRTGVGDVRELIETVHYAPANARYKIYIIDEVHMLSNQAFNALLKTLEEPPPHVIFIFATTEIRKIPVTILSRCQRFDLKRLDTDMLAEHLANVCAKEQVTAEEEALRLLAMAAEGSVRDGLSLLDQAIAHSLDEAQAGTCHITAATARTMLGLSDRTRMFALLEHLFAGETLPALELLGAQYRDGADMPMLFQDMLSLVHTMTRLVLAPGADLGPAYSDAEKEYARSLAARLGIMPLTRAWQMLARAQEEVKRSGSSLTTAEMALIRFAHAAQLPTPAEVIRSLKESGEMPAKPAFSSPPPRPTASLPSSSGSSGGGATALAPREEFPPEPMLFAPEDAPSEPHLSLAAVNPPMLVHSFEDILALCEARREPILSHHLTHAARVVACEPGVLTLSVHSPFPADIARRLADFLTRATDRSWRIATSEAEGLPTLAEQRAAEKKHALEEARHHPLVEAVMHHFPDAQIIDIK